jgi:hypothetical protein
MAERYLVTHSESAKVGFIEILVGRWNIVCRHGEPVACLHDALPNAEQEIRALCNRLNDVEQVHIDVSIAEVRSMFRHIERQLSEIQNEVKKNMDPKLGQALDGLETAATNKVAEDQIVDGLAAQAQDETAETARVQAVTDELTKETAAEQTLVAAQTPAPPAPPAPAAPAAPAAGSTTTTGS